MITTESILHLSLLQGIGPRTARKIIELADMHHIGLYDVSFSDWLAWSIPEKIVQTLVHGLADRRVLDEELTLIEREKVEWTTFSEKLYPALLWHTYAPPLVLYWQGTAVWNNGPSLSVVGSRDGNFYGRRAIESIVVPCIQQGLIIVSGGARGIDTMAHEAALRQGGQTVAILGSGLLKPYPTGNKALFSAIIEKEGAVMSCFPLNTTALGWQFPVRNRIIAGMTRGCLIIQAAKKSGALITASYALHEGRNVYAVPGLFDDPLSAGCHELLQEGAQLTHEAAVILRDYQLTGQEVVECNREKETKNSIVKSQKEILFEDKKQPVIQEDALLRCCIRPTSLDQLIALTGRDSVELQKELFMLQLEGRVEQDFAGLWRKREG